MTKDELINKAKELLEAEDISSKSKEVNFLEKEINKFLNKEEDTLADKDAKDELAKYLNELKTRKESIFGSIYEQKKALVLKANDLLNTTNFKKASDDMNVIFNEFKGLPHCSKKQDDELWGDFKRIKDEFNEKRQAYFDGLRAAYKASKEAKVALINEAKEALELENIKEASSRFDSLMARWKNSGFAGKKDDDELWNEFNEIRKAFYVKKEAYFKDKQKQFIERVAKKEDLIKRARILLANSDFTHEEISKVKELRKEWKEIGFAGKEKDDELWNEFNGVVNKYFDSLNSNK